MTLTLTLTITIGIGIGIGVIVGISIVCLLLRVQAGARDFDAKSLCQHGRGCAHVHTCTQKGTPQTQADERRRANNNDIHTKEG